MPLDLIDEEFLKLLDKLDDALVHSKSGDVNSDRDKNKNIAEIMGSLTKIRQTELMGLKKQLIRDLERLQRKSLTKNNKEKMQKRIHQYVAEFSVRTSRSAKPKYTRAELNELPQRNESSKKGRRVMIMSGGTTSISLKEYVKDRFQNLDTAQSQPKPQKPNL